jgi:murein DD-endopeptidase MepM/ murein hydrolase activator NlpD
VPRHRRRSRRSRLLVPVGLGVVAFLAIGSLAAGSALAPDEILPVGVSAAVVHPALTKPPNDDPTAAVTGGAARVGPTTEIPDPRRAIPRGAPLVSDLVGYRWPLARARLTLPFGPTPWGTRIVDGERFHDGVDLATFCGDRIVAAHDGVVLAAGRHFDDAMGWLGDLTPYYRRLDAKKLWDTLPIVVVIDDGNTYRSMYAHFERVVVKPGQRVLAGALLGYEGRTGRASGCHLHYGLFSTFEPAAFAMDPGVVKRMKVPRLEIARVDPLKVLPPRRKPSPKSMGGQVPRSGPAPARRASATDQRRR